MHSSNKQQLTNSLLSLLEQAVSGTTTQTHKKIYEHINQIQTQANTYISLAEIVSQPTQIIGQDIKKMALIILKTSLKRNSDILQFSEEEFTNFRKSIIELPIDSDSSMQKAKRALISTLVTWNKSLDFVILAYLLSMINSQEKQWQANGLQIVKMVFEDLKFQTENFEKISTQNYLAFVDQFTQSFAHKFTQADTHICILCLECMNLIIHHIPPQSSIIKTYTESYLLPLLQNPLNQPLKMRIQLLSGLILIIQTQNNSILNNPNTLQLIINEQICYQQYLQQIHASNEPVNIKEQQINLVNEIKTTWLSLLLDLIVNDCYGERLAQFMGVILERVVYCLRFTKEDQREMNNQLEEEVNPYEYEEDEDDLEGDGELRTSWSYTPRKLAILCFTRIVINYPEDTWEVMHPHLQTLLKSSDFGQKELGLLLMGVLFQNLQEHLQFLQHYLPIAIEPINNPAYPIFLRCTALWTITKVAYLVVRQPVIQYQIQKELIKCFTSEPQAKIKNSAYLAIDEIVTNLQSLPKLMNQLICCLAKGIENCSGKSLYSILKVCATLYERHAQQIQEDITKLLIQKLCAKWNQYSNIESIMCPLIQCLVTLVSSNAKCLMQCGSLIFTQAAKLIQKTDHQKQLIIRIVDLLSALIALKIPAIVQWVSSDANFHSQIIYNKLLNSSEQQIVNFTYGLIGDICKCTSMNLQYAQIYLKAIGNSLMEKQALAIKTSNVTGTLTFCSNSLICLTDLLTAHPQLAIKNNYEYSQAVIEITVKKLSINNLSKVYAFNFARVYGRMGKLVPECGAQFIGSILMNACIGLRANQHNQLTDDAYEGLLKMIASNPQAATDSFEYFVDSFICYPCGRESVSSEFREILKNFKKSRTQSQWDHFVNRPIFLPAVIRKIEALCNS